MRSGPTLVMAATGTIRLITFKESALKTEVTIKFDESSRIAISAKFLQEASKRVAAQQKEQVNEAFVRGGQPGQPWRSLKSIYGTRTNKKGRKTVTPSYRNDGQPLRNTSVLKSSFFSRIHRIRDDKIVTEIATPLPYAVYQQLGMKTKGPNFIPLNRKAVRTHVKGMNPKSEGLVLGKDYIMAWKGVTVPARPMIDYSNQENKRAIISAAMKGT